MKYVYVLSHAFSGSTLLAFLLGSHPAVATIGEITVTRGYDREDYPCSCGELLRRCPFWLRVVSGMESAGLAYDFADPRLRFRDHDHYLADRALRAGVRGPWLEAVRSLGFTVVPGAGRARAELLKRNEVFAGAVLRAADRSVFVDISKHGNRLLHLSRSRLLDLHVIHLVRDSRAVASSCKKNLGMTAADGARSWLASSVECERVRARFDARHWMRARHEDLCTDPGAVMGELHRFLGIDSDDHYRDFRSSEHHIIGNRMRLGSSSEIKLDERWRTTLTRPELDVIDRVAGRRNRGFGYE